MPGVTLRRIRAAVTARSDADERDGADRRA
jgi:hypothetical protein